MFDVVYDGIKSMGFELRHAANSLGGGGVHLFGTPQLFNLLSRNQSTLSSAAPFAGSSGAKFSGLSVSVLVLPSNELDRCRV